MKKHKNNGFTLVELLAVVVIIGILLLLAIPSVTRQMNESRKKGVAEDARTIAKAVKDDILMHDTVLLSKKKETITYNKEQINNLLDKKIGNSPFGGAYDVASAQVIITSVDNKKNYTIRVCLIDENGNGFGYSNVDNLTAEYVEMDLSGNNCNTDGVHTGTAVIINDIVNSTKEDIKNQINEVGLGEMNSENSQVSDTDDVTEYHFNGDNDVVKNNYVYFNCSDIKNQSDSTCDLYRIIGVFYVDDGDGNFEERVKLMSVNAVNAPGEDSGKWNSTPSNDWTKSSLMTYFNTTFYNSINYNYKALMGDAKYYLGGYTYANVKRDEMYAYERKAGNDDHQYFHPYNEDSTYWVGKIALMYASDFGYATEDASCSEVELSSYSSDACGDNWIYRINQHPSPSWVLNQVSSVNNDAYFTDNRGLTKSVSVSNSNHPSHPVFYLTADAEFVAGDGTREKPFKLFK